MPKKPWYAGKTVNHEFKAAARAHALECVDCGQAPFTSSKEHQQWRNQAEEHTGASLPETFLTEAPTVNRNASRQLQGNIRLDLEAKKYD